MKKAFLLAILVMSTIFTENSAATKARTNKQTRNFLIIGAAAGSVCLASVLLYKKSLSSKKQKKLSVPFPQSWLRDFIITDNNSTGTTPDNSKLLANIATSPHQIPDWNDKKYLTEKEQHKRTNSHLSADYVVNQLADTAKQREYVRSTWKQKVVTLLKSCNLFKPAHQRNPIDEPNHFWGNFGDFIRRTEFHKFSQPPEIHYSNQLAHRLLTPTIPEHTISHINLGYGAHVFAIEKKFDGEKTWWRIHQSFENYFTLAEWHDLPGHPWQLGKKDAKNPSSAKETMNPIFTWLFDVYGKNRQIDDVNLIYDFIIFFADHTAACENTNRAQLACRIQTFTVTK